VHNIDLQWLLDIAGQAGSIARSHFGRVAGRLKEDNSLVTQADLAVEAFLREELARARPGEAILGEEGDDPMPDSEIVWAIDPVDGTRAFAHGFPVWGVSIGALVAGRPTVGAFLLPVIGDTYCTDGRTAYRNGDPLPPPDPDIDENAVLLISEGAFQRVYPGYAGKVLSLGSAAAHLCYAATGSAVGAVDRASIWDYAAGAAILRAVGIRLRYVSGGPVDFRALADGRPAPEPTLACQDRHFDQLRGVLAGR
jgi:myo-inositol-1(or 4)-monophosphatase